MECDKKNVSADKKPENGGGYTVKILTGLFAGLVNGLFGGGGGMLIVPSLKYLLKYGAAEAHATAIAVILPVSVLSGIYNKSIGNFEWTPVLFTAIGSVIGGAAGAILLKKLSSVPITVIFSVVMAAAGVKMLFF